MPAVIALIRDLLFASKVTATARSQGLNVQILRDGTNLPTADLLLVDLNQTGALESAIAWKTADAKRCVIGFVSHVDNQTIQRAREGGIDQVLARSAFVEKLPAILDSQVT